MSDSMRILILHLNALGDVVRGTAVAESMKSLSPNCRVDFLTDEAIAPMLLNNPVIDRIHTLGVKRIHNDMEDGKSLADVAYDEIFTLAERLRYLEYDLAVNLHFSTISSLLTGLASDGPYVGMRFPEKGQMQLSGPAAQFVHKMIYHQGPGRGEAPLYARYVWMLRDAGLRPDVAAARTRLAVTDEETRWANGFFDENDLRKGRVLVGLHPGAGWKDKRWSPSRFAEVANFLIDEFDARIMISGVPVELEKIIKPAAELMKTPPILMAGRADLRESMALIGRCDLFIANDTGPMHIAGALGVPTIALFGDYLGFEARPCGRGHALIVGNTMDGISVSAVTETAKHMLEMRMANKEIQKGNRETRGCRIHFLDDAFEPDSYMMES